MIEFLYFCVVFFVCAFFQLAPVVQNTHSHEQSSSVAEPILHKDDLDSILGDVSGAQLHADSTDVDAI